MANCLARMSIGAGAITGAVAVMLGAFGSHALRGVLDAAALATWHTAVEYQAWHAFALLACGAFARQHENRALRVAAFAFASGIVLFCVSLYLLALGAPRWLGAITPLGGVAFITGWIALGVHARRA
ncbi:DUF423 domain-containing protein [Dokdonella fugitiva]|jgi:uncharacterized membrane protein YgdD (TMEM256/DUF423 family)|uniref:DUF423 domain-containing protein n=1 Tax=Dokdonella fugitiva TaxID=328517 RepID=UPI0015FD881D|nr:DUF423 domain-containing protein [Dokdonella fugitiva]MBA8883132.1 uncharacterized membrane protein YgdD (TMEM256/DUF423 family) [Dokdonella fugitiva]